MKIVVEFDFKKPLNEHISDEFIFGEVLQSIPIRGVKMKIINRIYDGEFTFDSLEKSVCEYLDFKPEELQSRTRKREVVEGRQILHYIAKNRKMGTLSVIGFRYGKKDHATVMHSNRIITTLLQTDKDFKNQYQSFIESFFNHDTKDSETTKA